MAKRTKKNQNIAERSRGLWNAARGTVTGESLDNIAKNLGVSVNPSFRKMVKAARASGEGSLKVRTMISKWLRDEGHVSQATQRRHAKAKKKTKAPARSRSVEPVIVGTTQEIVSLIATAQGITEADLTQRILDAWASRKETLTAAQTARTATAAASEASEAAEAAVLL